ncbi:MAG: hypothetical protein P8M25_13645 [Paracoccaceae bacterium]|nr:hypothetical protein [Paracoccaceae bacterium]
MSPEPTSRGAAPVGHLQDLTPIEAGAVLYLRLWCEGSDAQAQINSDFRLGLGTESGDDAFAALSRLNELIIQNGRRPLIRHALECRCIGADESCFATMIASAADNDYEDSLLLASLMVKAPVASVAASLAFQVGRALKFMTKGSEFVALPPGQKAHILH